MTQILDSKVALITGTAGGQGRAAALKFAQAGARVMGCDVNANGNAETARLVKEAGGDFTDHGSVDLGDPDEARAWVEACAARFVPFESFSFEDWSWTIRNELHIVFNVTQPAWAWLGKQGGVIINIASVAGIAGSGPGGAAHAASKGGVIALTKHLASEGAPIGIRVVAISPGVIETPGTAPMLADPQFREALIGRNMIKRAGQPADIVGLALFLASEEASYITGANVVVDGGRVAW